MSSTLVKTDYRLTRAILDIEYLAAERYRGEHDGLLPCTPFWRYAERKYLEAPHRFRHWHTGITRWIIEDLRLREPTCTIGCKVRPLSPGSGCPEPPGLLLLAVGLACLFGFIRKGGAY